jgi:DNA invertase Pin-like site-specific DNA recombinase
VGSSGWDATAAMKILGYCRVSTADQEETGKSLDAQEHAIRYHAAGKLWHIAGVAREHGSGKDLGREKLQHTLQRLADGEADGLVVTRLDRLTRSLTDFCQLVEWFNAAERTLVVLDFDLDTSTPAGELIAHMMAALAQWQRRVIAENTRAALQEKRRRGEPINQGSIHDHPEIASLIRNMHSCGSSYRQIAAHLNANHVPTVRGGESWSTSVIGTALGKTPARGKRDSRLPEVR